MVGDVFGSLVGGLRPIEESGTSELISAPRAWSLIRWSAAFQTLRVAVGSPKSSFFTVAPKR